MKRFLAIILMVGSITVGFSQEKDTVSTTDTLSKTDKVKKKVSVEITIGKDKADTVKKDKSSRKFSAGLTLARLDLGFSRYLDNGSFTLSPANSFLEFENWKTHNIGFEFFQLGYRFNNHFKIYIATGLDWNHIRLKRNITFQKDQPTLTYINEPIEFKKNRLSSQYLRVPLSFQFRTSEDHRGNKFYLVAGPELGFLLNGKQKQVSEERGKEKVKDDFNFEPFRYGGFVRLGYANIGLYSKFYFNDVFAENQGPGDFKNISFGLTFGF